MSQSPLSTPLSTPNTTAMAMGRTNPRHPTNAPAVSSRWRYCISSGMLAAHQMIPPTPITVSAPRPSPMPPKMVSQMNSTITWKASTPVAVYHHVAAMPRFRRRSPIAAGGTVLMPTA